MIQMKTLAASSLGPSTEFAGAREKRAAISAFHPRH
uniref:Uncharacterized protein n=1 Tax=Anguilla anguilla TaxID=7936 RepID=A0A0E9U2T5_ANGAN